MAEIKIEKKKPIWPWILVGLIVLGIILYFLLAGNNDDMDDMDDMDDNRTEQVRDTTYTGTRDMGTDNSTAAWDDTTRDTLGTSNEESVSTYLTHVGDRDRMGVDHEYTNNALLHLIDAVEAKAAQANVDIEQDLEEMRKDAEAITENPQATNHANHIKETGSKIADAMEKIQERNYPNLGDDVEDVRTALQEIDGSVMTLEQREEINSFFKEAADVLRRMS